MLWLVVAGLVGVVLLRILVRAQTRLETEEDDRRARQRARILGAEKIPGADGKYEPGES